MHACSAITDIALLQTRKHLLLQKNQFNPISIKGSSIFFKSKSWVGKASDDFNEICRSEISLVYLKHTSHTRKNLPTSTLYYRTGTWQFCI